MLKKEEKSWRSRQDLRTPWHSDILLHKRILLANVQSMDNKLCGTAGAHLIPTRNRTAVLFASQKHGCLLCSRLSHRAHGLLRASASDMYEESSQGKAEGGVFVFYINNLWCDERNIHSIKFLLLPLIWNFICFCVDHSGYRGNLQRSQSRLFIYPPQANTDQALRELYRNISEQ